MIFYPDLYLSNVKEISVEILKRYNIKGLILDLDNTLIDYRQNMLEGLEEWCQGLKNNNIKICILSNTNNIKRVKKAADALDIPFISFAKKPLKYGFKKAQRLLWLESKEIAAARRPDTYRCCSGAIEAGCSQY